MTRSGSSRDRLRGNWPPNGSSNVTSVMNLKYIEIIAVPCHGWAGAYGGVCDGTTGIGSGAHGGRGRRTQPPRSRGHDIGSRPRARMHRAAAREGREADGRGARGGCLDGVGEQVVAAIRAAGARGSHGSLGSGGSRRAFRRRWSRRSLPRRVRARRACGGAVRARRRRKWVSRRPASVASGANTVSSRTSSARSSCRTTPSSRPSSGTSWGCIWIRRRSRSSCAATRRRRSRRWNVRNRGCRWPSATSVPKRTTTIGTARSRCSRR